MDILKGLRSTLLWTKARILFNLKSEDVLDPDIFSAVLSLLDDNSIINIPPGTKEQDEMALIGLLIEQPKKADCEHQKAVSRLGELAEIALTRNLPGTDRALQILLSHALGRKFRVKQWIDKNFWNFNWKLPQAAFMKYFKTLAAADHTCLQDIFHKVKPKLIRWCIRTAIRHRPPLTRILLVLASDYGQIILENIPAFPSQAPLLCELIYQLASRYKGARAYIRELADQRNLQALAYLAVEEPETALALPRYLDAGLPLDKKNLQQLIKTVCRKKPYPVYFPLDQLISADQTHFILKELSDNVPAYIRLKIYNHLLAEIPGDTEKYPLLFKLALLGGLHQNPSLSKLFWKLLKEKLQSLLPPPEFEHPLLLLSSPDVRPVKYRENLINFLKDNLISVSFTLNCLATTHILPREKKIIQMRIKKEIRLVEHSWEEEKQQRYQYPNRYWYIDRESPISVLAGLAQKWANMRQVALNLGLPDEVRQIDNLSSLDWKQTLLDLSEST